MNPSLLRRCNCVNIAAVLPFSVIMLSAEKRPKHLSGVDLWSDLRQFVSGISVTVH